MQENNKLLYIPSGDNELLKAFLEIFDIKEKDFENPVPERENWFIYIGKEKKIKFCHKESELGYILKTYGMEFYKPKFKIGNLWGFWKGENLIILDDNSLYPEVTLHEGPRKLITLRELENILLSIIKKGIRGDIDGVKTYSKIFSILLEGEEISQTIQEILSD